MMGIDHIESEKMMGIDHISLLSIGESYIDPIG